MTGMRGGRFLLLVILVWSICLHAPNAQAYDGTPAQTPKKEKESRLDSLISTVSNEIVKKTDDQNRLKTQLEKQTYTLDRVRQDVISTRTALVTARERVKELETSLKEVTKRLAAELDQSEANNAVAQTHELARKECESAQDAAMEPLKQTISYRSAMELLKNAQDRLNKLQTTAGISNSTLLAAAATQDKCKQIVEQMEKTTLGNNPDYLTAQEKLNQAVTALAARKAVNKETLEKNHERLALLAQLEKARDNIKINQELVAACARRVSAAENETLKTRSELSRVKNDGQKLETIRDRWEQIKRKNQERNRQ